MIELGKEICTPYFTRTQDQSMDRQEKEEEKGTFYFHFQLHVSECAEKQKIQLLLNI